MLLHTVRLLVPHCAARCTAVLVLDCTLLYPLIAVYGLFMQTIIQLTNWAVALRLRVQSTMLLQSLQRGRTKPSVSQLARAMP